MAETKPLPATIGKNEMKIPELKATLTLPQTDFPMKANLPVNEPLRLAQWQADGLYEQIRAARKGAQKYILHDGPPYANGPLHLGHALNKCLKDFVVKSKTMQGYDAPYVPGFDCHGLPIEIKVDEQLGRKKLEMPAEEFLHACRAYAQKYVDLQRSQFVRLGVFGAWDKAYTTMSKEYEAATLATFYSFFEQGFVYKGLKPVYWCIHDRTALAEAEVEYEMHTSPSVYVRYTLTSAAPVPELEGRRVWAIIWTTTPWTLPASLAIAFHPELDYVALEQNGDTYLVAEALVPAVRTACGLEQAIVVARLKGFALDRATFQHPFLDRSIVGVNAGYVTTDQGTGAVHTAPAHGADDFLTGVRYGLDPTCNVDNGGRLRNGLAEFEGKTVFQANPEIIKLLEERGALMGQAEIYHSYPHCWRCHKPVISRATEQWFIGMETDMPYSKLSRSDSEEEEDDAGDQTFRERALQQIHQEIKWDPAWGEERIANMIATRPDWCISRQRVWGVPIAVFICNTCHKPLQDCKTNARIVALFREQGIDAWHTHSVAQLLGEDFACPGCGAVGTYEKEQDILDVWFDSGSSWRAVLESDSALGTPADLYFEGGDQFRGWFHTSLLTSVGTSEDHGAPYKKVATNGWTLDEQGRAMSKSLGNGVDPVDISTRLGAEIVRLWVASVDFREDVAASENLMQRVADNYRQIRNTFRFLLGNLHGFIPVEHSIENDELHPLDLNMLVRTNNLVKQATRWYESMEFHRIYHALNDFCVVDLSSFYLDVLKDRMYTFAPNSHERRSAQTVIWKITEALVRLVAPILSFTADEVWQYLPMVEGRKSSVHLANFHKDEYATPDAPNQYLRKQWPLFSRIRTQTLKELENLRQQKRIGKSIEAKVVFKSAQDTGKILEDYNLVLKEILGVAQVDIQITTAEKLRNHPEAHKWSEISNPWIAENGNEEWIRYIIEVERVDGTKCNRCWNYRTDTGDYGPWIDVCGRCAEALDAMGYSRETGERGVA